MYQVANLNPKDLSYTLKDYVFKELQRDWPGYNEIDRRSLESVLSRYVLIFFPLKIMQISNYYSHCYFSIEMGKTKQG